MLLLRFFQAVLAMLITAAPMSALDSSPVPQKRPYEIFMPELRWDHMPKGRSWTKATMSYINGHGAALTKVIPNDIHEYCPGYANQDRQGRAAFWAGLISSLSFHESTWNEAAVGGGGLWIGLTQIAPPTADWRRCNVRSAQALKNGKANLSCAVRIMAITVPRDKVVSRGMRGVAADWGPFHSQRKREDMMRWTKKQPFCREDMKRSLIPMPRPVPSSEQLLAQIKSLGDIAERQKTLLPVSVQVPAAGLTGDGSPAGIKPKLRPDLGADGA